MYESNGVGLAAPQINKAIRVFLIDTAPFIEEEEGDAIKKVFINAEIIEEDGEEWIFNEGCLSIPDVREDIKLSRRIKRDAKERGYSEEIVRYQWDNHVLPSYKAYLRPFRDDANIIITNNSTYDRGLRVFADHLNMVIREDRQDSYFL